MFVRIRDDVIINTDDIRTISLIDAKTVVVHLTDHSHYYVEKIYIGNFRDALTDENTATLERAGYYSPRDLGQYYINDIATCDDDLE